MTLKMSDSNLDETDLAQWYG